MYVVQLCYVYHHIIFGRPATTFEKMKVSSRNFRDVFEYNQLFIHTVGTKFRIFSRNRVGIYL